MEILAEPTSLTLESLYEQAHRVYEQSAQIQDKKTRVTLTFRDVMAFWWISRCGGAATLEILTRVLGEPMLFLSTKFVHLQARMNQLGQAQFLDKSILTFPRSVGGPQRYAVYSLTPRSGQIIRSYAQSCPLLRRRRLASPIGNLQRKLIICQYQSFLLDAADKGWCEVSTERFEEGKEISYCSQLKSESGECSVVYPGWEVPFPTRTVASILSGLEGEEVLLLLSTYAARVEFERYFNRHRALRSGVEIGTLDDPASWLRTGGKAVTFI
jgi:hypothetical protein